MSKVELVETLSGEFYAAEGIPGTADPGHRRTGRQVRALLVLR